MGFKSAHPDAERWGRLADLAFKVGLVIKGLDGLAEAVLGALFLASNRAGIDHWVRALTAGELSEDPTDFVATHLRRWAAHLSLNFRQFLGVSLIIHGLVNAALAACVLLEVEEAYLWAMMIFAAFAAYTGYRAANRRSPALAAIFLADAAIVALLAWEHKRLGRGRRDPAGAKN
ncbi:MAG TPA: DUF2127 domain-containing protein [Elusimicrobiota bacterium]|nr:DUF2127 domain-containing protein [Elusimicrobiota bacterium]